LEPERPTQKRGLSGPIFVTPDSNSSLALRHKPTFYSPLDTQ
jgi:hypothetical protein